MSRRRLDAPVADEEDDDDDEEEEEEEEDDDDDEEEEDVDTGASRERRAGCLAILGTYLKSPV